MKRSNFRFRAPLRGNRKRRNLISQSKKSKKIQNFEKKYILKIYNFDFDHDQMEEEKQEKQEKVSEKQDVQQPKNHDNNVKVEPKSTLLMPNYSYIPVRYSIESNNHKPLSQLQIQKKGLQWDDEYMEEEIDCIDELIKRTLKSYVDMSQSTDDFWE